MSVQRGRRLGEFVVGERIGRGGFADVYAATQPSLGRNAVIKVLRGVEHVRRFEQEARMACQLDHPYAAHVYAFGIEPDELLWIAMELVRGVSLAEWLATKGPIPLGRFVGLFERLCEVVHTAHQAGLIHRDIKPANVMVVTRAGKLMPKLLDFGIAIEAGYPHVRAAAPTTATFVDEDSGDDDSTDPTQSEDRRASGTPAYMAPEQWRGTNHDHRVDVYALGTLAYRSLTGRSPIVGRTAHELFVAHHHQAIPPMGEGFSIELDHVLATALAKDASARQHSALELAVAFKRAAGRDAAFLPRDEIQLWLTSAPPHLAACLAVISSARTLAEALEVSRQLCDVLAQWIGVVSLAAAASLDERPDTLPQLSEIRTESLATRDWLDLAATLCLPYAERDEDFPIPEMVRWFIDEAGPETLLATRAASRADASEFPRDLMMRVLHGLRFLSGYTLISGATEWTAATHGTIHHAQEVWLSDGDGNALFEVSPLVTAASPAPGEQLELFVISGGGRTGARQIATPQGFERESDLVWPWLERMFRVIDDDREPTIADRAPYRGLAPFSTADTDLFFGRSRAVEQLFNRVVSQPFLALTGPSGSGKSSLVFAGLIPRMPEPWISIALRPGRNPVTALDAALSEAGVPGLANVAAIAPWLRDTGRRMLLVIDQAEELLTLASAEERSDVAAALAYLVAAAGDRVRVVVTLRHDFIARADEMPEWRELIQHNLLLATIPNRTELAEMVISPATQVGYGFDDPPLVDDMIGEVVDRPGALPLLSFAASRLWDARDVRNHQLTRAAYDAMGGVAGALAGYAEELYGSLSPRQQQIARELLRRLVTAEGTSAPTRRDELATLGVGTDVVLDRLVAARILVTCERPDGLEDIAIVHEALIDRWHRLVAWRAEDEAGARHLDELRAAAARWTARDRDASYLWLGDALAIYRQWMPRWEGALTADESAFGTASLVAASRGRRRRRTTITVALLALMAAVFTLVVLYRRAEDSRQQTEERFTDTLLDRGRSELLEGRPLQALVYFSAAYQRGRDSPGLRVALGIAGRVLDRELARARASSTRFELAISDDGDVALTTGANEPARSWTIKGGTIQRLATYERTDGYVGQATDFGGGIVGGTTPSKPLVLWNLDGTRRATGKDPGAGWVLSKLNVRSRFVLSQWGTDVVLWTPDAVLLGALSNPARPPGVDGNSLLSSLFSKDEAQVTLVFKTGFVETWRTADRVLLWQAGLEEPILAARSTEERIVIATMNGAFVAFSKAGAQLFRKQAHANVWSMHISKDGTVLVTVGRESQIKLWSLVDGAALATLDEPVVQAVGVAISPNGKLVVAGGGDTRFAIWDVENRIRLGMIDTGRSANGFTFVEGGDALLVSDASGWLRLFDLRPDHLARVFDQRAEVLSAAFRPDSHIVSTFAANGTIRHQRTDTGEVTGELKLLYDEPASPFLQRIDYLPDGRLVAPYRTHEAIWDTTREAGLGLLALHAATMALAVGVDNRIAVSNVVARPHYQLMVWDADRQRILAHHQIESMVMGVVFHPSGAQLAFQTAKQVGIWDLHTDQIAWTAEVASTMATDVAVSPDGRYLTSTSDDSNLRIWSWSTGELVRSIKQPGHVMSLAFSPDGALIATANSDHNLYLWDVATGMLAGRFEGHTSIINDVKFSPDGKQLVSVSRDQHALVWNIPYERRTPDELARVVAERVPFKLVGGELVEVDP